MGAVTEQVRRNTEMFEQAMRMFLPFANGNSRPDAAASSSPPPRSEAPATPHAAPKAEASDMDALRRQLDEMQKRLDRIAEK
jgi:polyhydroxyalkanoate synthesis regulator protein